MKEQAMHYIPHRPPMVMIDELVEVTESAAATTFRVTAGNLFVEGGKLLEAGMIENMAQTAAAQAGFFQQQRNLPVAIGFLAAVKSWNLRFHPRVDSQLTTRVTIANQVGDILLLVGEIHSDDVLACSCELRIFVQSQPTV